MDREIVDRIKSVRIQISNICNLSSAHDLCPTHCFQDRKSLPSKIVGKIISELSDIGFTGNVGFHTYNDPLCDPRLMTFIDWVNLMLPKSYALIYTNGEYLTDCLVDELLEKSVKIIVSTYSQYSKSISERFGLEQCTAWFDDRLNAYSRTVQIDRINEPCGAPYSQLIIDVDGHVNLCCFDWASSVCFGDLKTQSIKEILESETMKNAYDCHQRGIRITDICQRCTTHR